MAALGRKLRTIEGGALAYYCPGCECCHGVWIKEPNPITGAKWSWDGNVEAPTFSPSILIRGECHCFVRAGMIEFLNDCTHALAGKTVPLPDFP